MMANDKWHNLLTEEVKQWYKNEAGIDIPDWYASYKARIAFVLF